MKYFKNHIILIIIMTNLFGQNFGGNIGLTGQFPQGEFKEEGVPAGIGLDINAMYYPVKELAFGLNLGGSNYGYSQRKIPASYFTDLVTITEKTFNEIFFGHLFFKILPFQGNIKPYLEGLVGLKNLSTRTELVSNSYDCTEEEEDPDYCQIAESTNATDTALSYGFGLGLEIKLLENKKNDSNQIISFFINGRYLWGGHTKYLKKGSIIYSDPNDGPVQTTFNWNESKTDLLQLNLGISVYF